MTNGSRNVQQRTKPSVVILRLRLSSCQCKLGIEHNPATWIALAFINERCLPTQWYDVVESYRELNSSTKGSSDGPGT